MLWCRYFSSHLYFFDNRRVFTLPAGLRLGQPANKSDILSSLPHRVVSTALNNIHPSPSPASTLSTVMKRTRFHLNPSGLLPKSTAVTISANPPCGSSFNNTGIVVNTLNACFGSSFWQEEALLYILNQGWKKKRMITYARVGPRSEGMVGRGPKPSLKKV